MEMFINVKSVDEGSSNDNCNDRPIISNSSIQYVLYILAI